MVSIPACHAGDRGSIPRRGVLFSILFPVVCWSNFIVLLYRDWFYVYMDYYKTETDSFVEVAVRDLAFKWFNEVFFKFVHFFHFQFDLWPRAIQFEALLFLFHRQLVSNWNFRSLKVMLGHLAPFGSHISPIKIMIFLIIVHIISSFCNGDDY